MEQFKEAIFTRRLNVFNETFAGLGSRKKYATIWHEATAGRNDEDIASTYYSFIKANRDAETITIWADNCTAQNRNWTLYTIVVKVLASMGSNDINIWSKVDSKSLPVWGLEPRPVSTHTVLSFSWTDNTP